MSQKEITKDQIIGITGVGLIIICFMTTCFLITMRGLTNSKPKEFDNKAMAEAGYEVSDGILPRQPNPELYEDSLLVCIDEEFAKKIGAKTQKFLFDMNHTALRIETKFKPVVTKVGDMYFITLTEEKKK